MDKEIEFIPPLGYFLKDEPGVIYLIKEAFFLRNFAIEGYEVLEGDDGDKFLCFKKRGKDKTYFLCPFPFLERVIASLKEDTPFFEIRLIFVLPLRNIDEEGIGLSIKYKFSVVEVTKLLLKEKKRVNQFQKTAEDYEIEPFEILT